jgi:hypothetical protein
MPSTSSGAQTPNQQGQQPSTSGNQPEQSAQKGQEQGGSASNESAENSDSNSGEQGDITTTEIAGDETSPSLSDDIDFSEEDPSNSESADSAQNQQSQNQQSQGGQSASTDSEQVAQMDERLNESLGSYDGMILREREYIQNSANQQGSEEQVANADRRSGRLYDEAGETQGEETIGQQRPGAPQNSTSGRAGGAGNIPTLARSGDNQHKSQTTPPPADIPSGHDDDVVARQIREAAMREADPKLREKLWQEYRKYKNQPREE